MANLVLTTNIVLPVFIVMIAGYVCKRAGLLNAESTRAINKLVFYVFLPFSLGEKLMNVDMRSFSQMRVLVFCFAGVLAVCFGAMLVIPRLEKDNKRVSVLIQAAFRSNYAIFGIPLAEALYPSGDNGIAAMMVLATVPVFNVLAVFVLEYYRGNVFNMKKTARGILKNPLIIGCMAGFLLNLLPFEPPVFLTSSVSKISAAASPIALFALGASVDFGRMRGNIKLITLGASVRLIVVPALTVTLACLLGFRGAELAVTMIVFSAPCAVNSFTMAAQMDADAELAGHLVMATTVFSSLTVFLFVYVLKTLTFI